MYGIAFSLHIYFDFSGYSDMAIGLGKLFGFDFIENFNYPYISKSATEFWRRWHISLGTWFRDYIYIPLGGNRNGRVRTYANILIVFTISGLWHGTGWTFLIWGIMHGVFQIVERLFPKIFKNMHPALSWMVTFSFVNIAWVFFRADTVSQAISILVQLARMSFTSLNDEMVALFNLPELVWISQKILPIDILAHYENLYCFGFLLVGLIGILGYSNSLYTQL
jgi:alginate O-acetyltransferase complex protein AlgI